MNTSSRRAKRMRRHHAKKGAALNLVSLMDIFTILVFFLLVNSSSTPELPGKKDLELPKSTAKATPAEDYYLAITPREILFAGNRIISLSELGYADINSSEKSFDLQSASAGQSVMAPAKKTNRVVINKLKTALEKEVSEAQIKTGQPHSLTIVADGKLPYDLMRRIILTCQAANFLDIRFAATQIVNPSDGIGSSNSASSNALSAP